MCFSLSKRMRKIILRMHISLDGFVAGLDDDLDWVIHDEEVWEDGNALLSTTDTALFGRVTYEGFASYWPSAVASPSSTKYEREFARWIDAVPKIVLSTSLEKVEWKNSRLVKANIADEITKLKQQSGKDMMIMGSPTVAQMFMRKGWLDEYWLNINPVVLGHGKSLFMDIPGRLNLKLLQTKKFSSGVIGVRYETQHS